MLLLVLAGTALDIQDLDGQLSLLPLEFLQLLFCSGGQFAHVLLEVDCAFEATPLQKEQRLAFTKRLTASHSRAIPEHVRRAWDGYKATLPEYIQATLPQTAPDNYVKKEYWPIVEHFVKNMDKDSLNTLQH